MLKCVRMWIFVGMAGMLAGWASPLVEAQEPAAKARAEDAPVGWKSLFNGRDLAGWMPTLGPAVEGVNPDQVFQVVDLDGERVIRISGQMLGGLATREEFGNYHLKLEFKWGEKRFAPRAELPRDSGLLYHGADSVNAGSGWLESVEFGILEGGETGDFWSVPGSHGVRVIVDVEGEEIPPPQRRYPEESIRYVRGGKAYVGTRSGILNGDDNEKPRGQWNTLELICLGQTSLHVVNGSVNLVLTGTRRAIDGKEVPLTRGRLQLQSEGAEVYYRNIQLRPIEEIPAQFEAALKEPPINTLSDQERSAGWRLLFDGQTTKGWRGYRQNAAPKGWQALEGALVRATKSGDLITTEQFDDFELSIDWKISEGGNSGIFYRATEAGKDIYTSAPEYEIRDNAYWLDDTFKSGANYALHPYDGRAARPVGYWNRARIVVRGGHVEHWLNGQRVVAYELHSAEWKRLLESSKYKEWPEYAKAPRGHIGLQDHDARVWYRNIKIRPLESK